MDPRNWCCVVASVSRISTSISQKTKCSSARHSLNNEVCLLKTYKQKMPETAQRFSSHRTGASRHMATASSSSHSPCSRGRPAKPASHRNCRGGRVAWPDWIVLVPHRAGGPRPAEADDHAVVAHGQHVTGTHQARRPGHPRQGTSSSSHDPRPPSAPGAPAHEHETSPPPSSPRPSWVDVDGCARAARVVARRARPPGATGGSSSLPVPRARTQAWRWTSGH